MKLKTLSLPILIGIMILIHTVDCQDYQHFSGDSALNAQKQRWTELTQPIQFTRAGVQTFLEEIFNRKDYTEEVLPHSLGHLIQFLAYGSTSKQDITYIESSFRLFLNKIKQVRYISAESASHFIERMPNLLNEYFKQESQSVFDSTKREIKSVLYDMFLNKFAFFKQEPDHFFDETCSQIVTLLQEKSGASAVSKEQCRQLMMRFVEHTLSKIIWNPSDQVEVWTSFKTLSQQLAVCENEKLINSDELDDLLHSLVERFIYFLEMRGSDLTLSVIDTMKTDLAAGTLVIANVEEQEQYIASKVSRLEQAIMETEAKILARDKGIVTN